MPDPTTDNSIALSLLKRYQQFREKHFEGQKTFTKLVEKGQKPKVLIVACCDSRVDPALLTNSNPGELFVVRNIANLVPSHNQQTQDVSVSAALEYGVIHLGITDIIVLGHQYCGGIRALLETNDEQQKLDYATKWVTIAQPAKEKVLAEYPGASFKEQLNILEKESLRLSLENLKTFPFIKERLLKNQLSLHAWYFTLDSGDIEIYQKSTNKFILSF